MTRLLKEIGWYGVMFVISLAIAVGAIGLINHRTKNLLPRAGIELQVVNPENVAQQSKMTGI
jgi:hypothetical protein